MRWLFFIWFSWALIPNWDLPFASLSKISGLCKSFQTGPQFPRGHTPVTLPDRIQILQETRLKAQALNDQRLWCVLLKSCYIMKVNLLPRFDPSQTHLVLRLIIFARTSTARSLPQLFLRGFNHAEPRACCQTLYSIISSFEWSLFVVLEVWEVSARTQVVAWKR